ncbi:GAF domain-containing sensor histidine kinase [Anaeromyxobacter paludicola]|uniref:histidine kinase n=1 Tax=Anaeromyxobacter paludicola TaxID=2918171 RepID=A0ABM7XDL0_9BACT|nr:ATP-binding protein [Anaeromyxobacter paludicola]BDG09964.1 hypothetical protein AMPC_30770 [Anaeromyxobacter paludicola]
MGDISTWLAVLLALALGGMLGLAAGQARHRRARAGDALRLRLLETLARDLAGATTLAEAARAAFDACAAGVRPTQLAILLPGAGGQLEVVNATGFPEGTGPSELPLSPQSAPMEVFRSGEVVWLPDPAACDARFPTRRAARERLGLGSFLGLPLAVRGERIGVLTLGFGAPEALGEADRSFARTVADRCAITLDRVRLLEGEQRLRTEREDLVRGISHDLRTPLSAIVLQARLAAREASSVPAAAQRATAIEASARRMAHAIEDLVQMARFAEGQIPVEPERIELRAFALEVRERLFPGPDQARIAVAAPPGLAARADPRHLERILMNLVNNALENSPEGSPVEVGAAQAGREVLLSVRDRGAGIPAAELPGLFQRYVRGQGARRKQGLGLGLFIARLLSEAQGGRIEVESAEGEGSTFRVALPGDGV